MKLRSMQEIREWFLAYHEITQGYVGFCGKAHYGYKLVMVLKGHKLEIYAENINQFKLAMEGLMEKYPIQETS